MKLLLDNRIGRGYVRRYWTFGRVSRNSVYFMLHVAKSQSSSMFRRSSFLVCIAPYIVSCEHYCNSRLSCVVNILLNHGHVLGIMWFALGKGVSIEHGLCSAVGYGCWISLGLNTVEWYSAMFILLKGVVSATTHMWFMVVFDRRKVLLLLSYIICF